jgi:hypothetical protein
MNYLDRASGKGGLFVILPWIDQDLTNELKIGDLTNKVVYSVEPLVSKERVIYSVLKCRVREISQGDEKEKNSYLIVQDKCPQQNEFGKTTILSYRNGLIIVQKNIFLFYLTFNYFFF